MDLQRLKGISNPPCSLYIKSVIIDSNKRRRDDDFMALIKARSKKESKKEIVLADSIWADIDAYCKYAGIGGTIGPLLPAAAALIAISAAVGALGQNSHSAVLPNSFNSSLSKKMVCSNSC